MAPMVNGLSALCLMLEFHLCGVCRDMPNSTVLTVIRHASPSFQEGKPDCVCGD